MAAQLPPVIPIVPDPVQVAFNIYLATTLGIREANVRAALNAQGLVSFDSFIGLSDDDMDTIAANVRKPGGTIPIGAGRNVANIPDPGLPIGFLVVRRLELLRFYVHHCTRIQRALVAEDMTIARLQHVYQMKETEDQLAKASDKPDLPAKIVKVDDVRINIEDLDDYLLEKRGESGLPLAYVVRDR